MRPNPPVRPPMIRPSGSGLLILVTVAVAAPPDRWSEYSFRRPWRARVLLSSSCADTTTGPPGAPWPPPTLWPSTRRVRFCLRRQRALEQAAPATSAPYRRDELAVGGAAHCCAAGLVTSDTGDAMFADLVLEGGGVKRIALVGAISSKRSCAAWSTGGFRTGHAGGICLSGRPQRCCCNETSGRAASTATAEADSAIMGCPCRRPRTWRYWRAQDEAILASWLPVPVCGYRPGARVSAGVRRGGFREPRLCRR